MATITRFEDLEVWQLARTQCIAFQQLLVTALQKDYELRSQMNRSSGSVMDCIAEGFERSGNAEFRNFLIMAKGSNGEYRSQLYRCLDRNYIDKTTFEDLYAKNDFLGKKIMSFISYLQKTDVKGQRYKKTD